MPCSFSVELVESRINGSLSIHAAAHIDSMKHSVTASVYAVMDDRLKSSAFYQQWFAAMLQFKRMRIISPADEASYKFPAFDEPLSYIPSSFFGGQLHVTSDPSSLGDRQKDFARYGITVRGRSDLEMLRPEDNPLLDIVLTTRTRRSPQELTEFFRGEPDVVVYDKYLPAPTAQILAVLASAMKAAAIVQIYTHRDYIDRARDCVAAIRRANPTLSVTAFEADDQTTKTVHDRHIFLGRRYHIRCTAGLAAFGDEQRGVYFNQEGSFTVFDVWDDWQELRLCARGRNPCTARIARGLPRA